MNVQRCTALEWLWGQIKRKCLVWSRITGDNLFSIFSLESSEWKEPSGGSYLESTRYIYLCPWSSTLSAYYCLQEVDVWHCTLHPTLTQNLKCALWFLHAVFLLTVACIDSELWQILPSSFLKRMSEKVCVWIEKLTTDIRKQNQKQHITLRLQDDLTQHGSTLLFCVSTGNRPTYRLVNVYSLINKHPAQETGVFEKKQQQLPLSVPQRTALFL